MVNRDTNFWNLLHDMNLSSIMETTRDKYAVFQKIFR